MKRPDLTFEQVSALLRCEPETGKMWWLPRPRGLFKSDRAWRAWNARNAGRPAFTASDGHGYRQGQIFKRPYKAHRVIWLLVTGAWPVEQIDHIDGDRGNDRFANFRDVSNAVNHRNNRRSKNNTSGVNGVYWHSRAKKWAAAIEVEGRRKHLGLFESIRSAADARAEANRQNGFTERHGVAA